MTCWGLCLSSETALLCSGSALVTLLRSSRLDVRVQRCCWVEGCTLSFPARLCFCPCSHGFLSMQQTELSLGKESQAVPLPCPEPFGVSGSNVECLQWPPALVMPTTACFLPSTCRFFPLPLIAHLLWPHRLPCPSLSPRPPRRHCTGHCLPSPGLCSDPFLGEAATNPV